MDRIMETRLTATVPAALDGERADRIVAAVAGLSRDEAKRLFELGVEVEGRRVEARHRLAAGQALVYPAPVPVAKAEVPDIELVLAHIDSDVVVVDKPAGLVVHPGAGQRGATLASALMARFSELEGVGQSGRWGLVHRLDRDTSGLLVVARTSEAHTRLTADLAARRIKRDYLALAHGSFELPTGTIDAPIERDPANRARKRVGPGGRPARTHYRVKEELARCCLLDVELETGRTHQIRVHLAAIDHPVVGDRLYSRRLDPVPMPRLFLHASRLVFPHPRTGEQIEIVSPLPSDLAQVLDRIRSPGIRD
jgi:23S rRNA pseudouridine1911/1915/1917 synthase